MLEAKECQQGVSVTGLFLFLSVISVRINKGMLTSDVRVLIFLLSLEIKKKSKVIFFVSFKNFNIVIKKH